MSEAKNIETEETLQPAPEQAIDTTIRAAPMPFSGWVRNYLVWLWILVTCAILGAPVVGLQAVLFPFGRANLWGDFTTWCFVVDGVENIKPGQTYVLCSNHRSHMDPLSVLHSLKRRLRFGFIMKRSLSLIPIFGWFIWMNGYIPIDRGGKKRGRDQLATGVKYLKKGRSVMMYPEGTRSPNHQFGQFKKGAVVLAIRAGVPILPIVVSGTATVWPKPSLFIRPGRTRVEVLPPIETAGLTTADCGRVLAEIKESIVARYRPEWDAPPLEETPALRKAFETAAR